MVHVENPNCRSIERPDSPAHWFSTIVVASETGEPFDDKEAVIAGHIGEHVTFDTRSVDVDADPDTGFIAIVVEIDGFDELPVATRSVDMALEALRDSNVDLSDLTFRGGRLVCGEQLSNDERDGWAPTPTDNRYYADDLMGPVFSEHRGLMAA